MGFLMSESRPTIIAYDVYLYGSPLHSIGLLSWATLLLQLPLNLKQDLQIAPRTPCPHLAGLRGFCNYSPSNFFNTRVVIPGFNSRFNISAI